MDVYFKNKHHELSMLSVPYHKGDKIAGMRMSFFNKSNREILSVYVPDEELKRIYQDMEKRKK